MEGMQVELEGSNIVVSVPGTRLKAIYQKSSKEEKLVEVSLWTANEENAPMTPEDFRERAEQAANAKARELAWFV